MKLVIKNNKIVATHDDNQNITIAQHYPEADMIVTADGQFNAGDDYVVDFAKAKEMKKIELATACENYIYVDFPLSNQTSILSIKVAGAAGAKLAQINAINAWIDSVLSEYYLRKVDVDGAADVASVNAVSSDFSIFDSTKPTYRLRTIRSASNS
jgi:hypothetical protein